jgi:hypothetical protein
VRLQVQPASGEERGVGLNGQQIRELERSPILDGVLIVDQWNVALTGGDLPGAAGLLAAVVLSACVAPALLSARVDQTTALRCE